MIELRPYQEQCLAELRQALREGHKTPLLQAPTGSGKSVIMAEIIRASVEKGNRVLVTVPKITLVEQMSAHLDRIGVDHGIMQADHWRTNPSKPVQLASIQTLIRRRMPDVRVVLVDEAHRVYSKMTEIIQRWNLVPFIGFSATPWTKGLGKIYTKLIKPVDIKWLIENDYLVDADIYAPSAPDLSGVAVQAGDYNKKQLGERVKDKALVGNIVDTWCKYAEGKQTIIAATNIAHSKQLVKNFCEIGVNAKHIDAYTEGDEREELIAGFKSGEITMLSSVAVLSEGADFPSAECLIIARPTMSRMFHVQIVGRVLRPSPDTGKYKAVVLDHADNFVRCGMHTDPTPDELDDGERGDPKERVQKERLPKVCPKCSAVKEAGMHECPQCGFAPERQNAVFEEAGSLVQVSKAAEKRNRTETWDDKVQFMAGLKGYAEAKGFKQGWVAHAYRDRYGVWPNDPRVKNVAPREPSQDVLDYVKWKAVKRAKQQKAINRCRYCGSTVLRYEPGVGPHYKGIRCAACNSHLGWLSKSSDAA